MTGLKKLCGFLSRIYLTLFNLKHNRCGRSRTSWPQFPALIYSSYQEIASRREDAACRCRVENGDESKQPTLLHPAQGSVGVVHGFLSRHKLRRHLTRMATPAGWLACTLQIFFVLRKLSSSSSLRAGCTRVPPTASRAPAGRTPLHATTSSVPSRTSFPRDPGPPLSVVPRPDGQIPTAAAKRARSDLASPPPNNASTRRPSPAPRRDGHDRDPPRRHPPAVGLFLRRVPVAVAARADAPPREVPRRRGRREEEGGRGGRGARVALRQGAPAAWDGAGGRRAHGR